jgi:hypothetical protein
MKQSTIVNLRNVGGPDDMIEHCLLHECGWL